MNVSTVSQSEKELRVYRWFLSLGGLIYLGWWEGVELLMPHAFNPFLSRLAVVAMTFTVLLLSYQSEFVRRHIRTLFAACCWVTTLHYFYLFYENSGESNWVIGSFVTITAISLSALSSFTLMVYSVFVAIVCLALFYLLPHLHHSVFLPGIITILVQANVALRFRQGLVKTIADSNDRFRLFFDSTFEGILVHDNGRIVDVNKAIIELTGRSREELVGQSVLSFIHPSERALIVEKIKHPDVPPYETKGVKKNGDLLDVEIRAKEFRHASGVARLVTVQDITDRKRAEKERVKAMTMSENVRVRDEFISLASHELKTPISSLKLQTQLIQRAVKRNPSEVYTAAQMTEFTSVFHRQIDRLGELVDTMLDVSRISSGRFYLDVQDVDVPALLRDVVATLQIETMYQVSIDAPEHLIIPADSSRLRQVIENLLTNTTKYGEGKPIHITVQTNEDALLLVVEDQGLGIAPESVDRIFNRFERAVPAHNISGLGLGLYITRQIVEAHGGTISVESRLGLGSKFTVALPLRHVTVETRLAPHMTS